MKVILITGIILLAIIIGGIIYMIYFRPIDAAELQLLEAAENTGMTDDTDMSFLKEPSAQTPSAPEFSVEGNEMNQPANYVEHQVLAVADSKREAKKIAKQIGGELLSYDNQVAVIQIGMTVEEMMQMLEDDPSLPKVYPNYQGYTTMQ